MLGCRPPQAAEGAGLGRMLREGRPGRAKVAWAKSRARLGHLEADLSGATDILVLEWTARGNRVLLTHDAST